MKKKGIIIILVSVVFLFVVTIGVLLTRQSLSRRPKAALVPIEQNKAVSETRTQSAKKQGISKKNGKKAEANNESEEGRSTPGEKWEIVEKFKGEDSTTTRSFDITVSRWKVAWSVIGEKGKEARCLVYEKGEDKHPVKEIKVRRIGPEGSVGYLGQAEIEKSGHFYFKIESRDCQWQIFVSELVEAKR